ncbi:S66 peptidase family protein [Neisseria leonii]|uniref:LD-carboxypeptidase n=1 Tax=Neisseria leonii TaxID=2995413 RepID=A0A9X4E1W6_9NEIS|nr:S66 peptidase family protein [Neisseria sp. 51.81]MDD9327659.1 LD-carboxypeptidase [Neisseria sp. 51.81]
MPKPFAPPKLRPGGHIRVLSPSSSVVHIGGFEANLAAKRRLEGLGFQVSFSEHYLENDLFGSAGIASRVADIHQAFADASVDAVLATIGGFNSNELLPHLDFDLIRRNPKIFCGYSDTTAVLSAIFAKTGLMTYYGASYSAFKMEELQEYQTQSWLSAVTRSRYGLEPGAQWSSDKWFLPDVRRCLFDTEWKVYRPEAGKRAQGRAVGGNLATFALLNGTPYAVNTADLGDYVLFLESSESHDYLAVSRQLAAVLQVYPEPQAVVFGRFPTECGMTAERWRYILAKHEVLQRVPVLYDLDFGHTQPLFTFALGARVRVDAEHLRIEVDEVAD